MNKTFGYGGAGDKRKAARGYAAGEELGKLADQPWAEPLGGQVVLVEAALARYRNRGQKFLQRLQLLAVDRVFRVLGLLEAKVILEPAMDGIVECKLDHIIGGWMRSDAAVEGVTGRRRIGRLGAGAQGTKQRANNENSRPSEAWLGLSDH